ncbi:MAG TPA: hypothetical protein PKX27_11935 [Bacteroidales bacterium]|jgi:hypothetical protein|nr:hypothetical protein [Bacteroidales bacterium]HOX74249.1 hypothetical protein [Bacteroidales bacterium]HPM88690.1 hypothetical protein [Bacteroidales bacterium]HQM69374.1 hypothetical protein [Bacteroidales bacterium]
MSKTVRILVFNNEIEAKLLSEILTSKEIPHIVRSFHDSALDGVFQVNAGWGVLEGPEKFRDDILKIYEEMSLPGNQIESI